MASPLRPKAIALLAFLASKSRSRGAQRAAGTGRGSQRKTVRRRCPATAAAPALATPVERMHVFLNAP